jgi:hypothetical protein
MKTVFKILALVVVLCALGAAGWGGYWYYRQHTPPGGAGRNMEVRLLARLGPAAPAVAGLGADASRGSAASTPAGTSPAAGAALNNTPTAPVGTAPAADLFSPEALRSYIASGDAPAGWKWLPVANGVEKEVTGNAPAGATSEYVTRTSNGLMYLLAADTPEMSLTHASGVRPWGVDSVQVIDDGIGPAVKIHLDKAGGDLMHDFTEKYLDHRIAVVVGGQICEVALVQSPVRSGLMVRLPAGHEADAESLRDALMK